MFLSVTAKQLLNEGKYLALQTLPIEELLDDASLEKLVDGRIPYQYPVLTQSTQSTVEPSLVQDPVSWSMMTDPVVISTGFIVARTTINHWLAQFSGAQVCTCPISNAILDPACIVALPQIAIAMAQWHLQHALVGDEQCTSATLKQSLFIGYNKVRLHIVGVHEPLFALLTEIFSGKENNSGNLGAIAYCAPSLAFTWRSKQEVTRVEFWYDNNRLVDSELIALVQAMLAPLNLPQVTDGNQETISLRALGIREYITADERDVTCEQAGECIVAFIKHLSVLRLDKRLPRQRIEDKVIRSSFTPQVSTHLGKRALFSSDAVAVAATTVEPLPLSVVTTSTVVVTHADASSVVASPATMPLQRR